MRSSKILGLLSFSAILSLQGGCALSPEKLAYRDRLEQGFQTPEDMERFKTNESEQFALTSDARSLGPLALRAMDVQLISAAEKGDSTNMKTLITGGARVNSFDQAGNSALLGAAREGELEAVRMLLKAGAYVDGRGGAMTPLAAAALRGHSHIVSLLIRSGADINAVGENGLSALMNAVKLNHLGVTGILLDARANTRVVDRAGDNLLIVAVSENYPDMLTLLLKHGVSVDMADGNGLTALYWADYLKRPALARILLNAGADSGRKKSQIIGSQPYTLGDN